MKVVVAFFWGELTLSVCPFINSVNDHVTLLLSSSSQSIFYSILWKEINLCSVNLEACRDFNKRPCYYSTEICCSIILNESKLYDCPLGRVVQPGEKKGEEEGWSLLHTHLSHCGRPKKTPLGRHEWMLPWRSGPGHPCQKPFLSGTLVHTDQCLQNQSICYLFVIFFLTSEAFICF